MFRRLSTRLTPKRAVESTPPQPPAHHPRIPRLIVHRREFDPAKIPDTLVLAGGGLNGIYGLGALATFKRAGLLEQVHHVVGTSAGAILGASFSLDRMMWTLDVAIRKKTTWDIKLHKLSSNFGVDSGKMLDDLLSAVFGEFVDITFEQLLKQRGIDFHVCVTNLTKRRPEYFCAATHPSMRVIDAVRHSCTIPLLFAVDRENEGDDIFVDGGIVANFPIARARTLTRSGNILGITYVRRPSSENIADLTEFASAIIEAAITASESLHTIDSNKELVLSIDADRMSMLDVDMKPRARLMWFASGAQQAYDFLDRIPTSTYASAQS